MLQTSQYGEMNSQDYFYMTRVQSILAGTGYTQTYTYAGFIVYDTTTGRPRYVHTQLTVICSTQLNAHRGLC